MTEPLPEFDPETALAVGRVIALHGVHGEIKVEPLTDFAERFDPGRRVWVDGAPLTIVASRRQGKRVLLSLDGVDSRERAEALRGAELQAPPERRDLGEDRYYRHDVIGLSVVDADGEALGRVADILTTGANDVYVVRGERGEILLPAIDDVVKAVDLARGRIVVELMAGLEFERPKPRRPAIFRKRARVAKPPAGPE